MLILPHVWCPCTTAAVDALRPASTPCTPGDETKIMLFKPLTSQPWRPIDRTEGCTMPAPLLASCAPTHLARKAVAHLIWHDSLLTTHMHLCCPRSCAIAATPTPMLTRCAAGTCSSSRSLARGGSGRTLSVRSRGAPLGTCTPRSCPRPPTRRRWPPRGEGPSRGAPKFCLRAQQPVLLASPAVGLRAVMTLLHPSNPAATPTSLTLRRPLLVQPAASSQRGPTRPLTCWMRMDCRMWAPPSGQASSTTQRWIS